MSQQPGRHEEKIKYSTCRKVRSVHMNHFRASAKGLEQSAMWRGDKGAKIVSTNKAPTVTDWYDNFNAGFRARVGERVKRDAAISIEIMLELQALYEKEWDDLPANGSPDAKLGVVEPAVFFILTFCASLRGFETPKILLTDLRGRISVSEGRLPPHCALTLRGRFKARQNLITNIMIFIANETNSGLRPGIWLQRLIDKLELKGITRGWLFQTESC